jgi:hypothetical protein
VLVLLAAVGLFAGLVYLGVPPFDNLNLFILTNVVAFFILLILGVVGGAFVGMLLAQRMLGNREFSPFEKTVLQSLQDIRERLDALESRGEEPRLRP